MSWYQIIGDSTLAYCQTMGNHLPKLFHIPIIFLSVMQQDAAGYNKREIGLSQAGRSLF